MEAYVARPQTTMMSNEFHSRVEFTPGSQRALEMAARWSAQHESMEISPQALLLGLLSQTECRAAAILAQYEITDKAVQERWPELQLNLPNTNDMDHDDLLFCLPSTFSPALQMSIDRAADWLAERMQPPELASEHLLFGLVCGPHELGSWLTEHGVTAEIVEKELYRLHGHLPNWEAIGQQGPIGEPIDMEDEDDRHGAETAKRTDQTNDEPSFSLSRMDQSNVLRVIDAASNRAREALRVLEDFVRFVLDDSHLTEQLKQIRHEMVSAVEPIAIEYRLAARETQTDVGTTVSTEDEHYRDRPEAVITANFSRLQESLRTLEEFLKLIDSRLAAAVEQLRYRAYTLQRAVQITRSANERLATARLYVLLDGRATTEEFQQLARELVLAGVDVLQLRDKQLGDRGLIERARVLREITQGSSTLFIMNDRPDLALLARADGVHVGQEELSVKDVRALVGPGMLIGVSTHSIEQARSAVLDGADYLGVGPTFASETKSFEHYPGLDLLRAVAGEISLPAFAIGGIDRDNLAEVLATGIRRIAVSNTVVEADTPATAAGQLETMLE